MAQEIFQKGNHYGLKYDGVEYYAAVFDEIKIKRSFVEGRMGTVRYNLSMNKENSQKSYRRFSYKHQDNLLIIGYTTDGKIDILNETGEIYYLYDGNYNKVLQKDFIGYNNDDMLIVRRRGKVGVYSWVQKREILPTEFTKIKVHESCEYGKYFIYARRMITHSIWDENGRELLKFVAPNITDISPHSNCEGYTLHWHFKRGYCERKRDGSYFLLKPKYDGLEFPLGNSSVIITENRERFGLYLNNRKIFGCKYEKITYIDDPYMVAIAEKYGVRWHVKKNGDLKLIRDDEVNENW